MNTLFQHKAPGPGPADNQTDLFRPDHLEAVDRAKTHIRDAVLAVARAWEGMPHSWAKRAAFLRVHKDPQLNQAELAVTRELNKLRAGGLEAAQVEEAEHRIREGMEFFQKRALELLKMK